MPPLTEQKKLTEAVFKSINEGTYPVDEDVVSSEVSSTVLKGLSTLLDQARADVKVTTNNV
jgi:hypothetical protein